MVRERNRRARGFGQSHPLKSIYDLHPSYLRSRGRVFQIGQTRTGALLPHASWDLLSPQPPSASAEVPLSPDGELQCCWGPGDSVPGTRGLPIHKRGGQALIGSALAARQTAGPPATERPRDW